jgi:hypothetical protein
MKSYYRFPGLYIFLSVLILNFNSCKEDECKAGGGGNLTLKLSTFHHTNPITGCTVKIKFNAKDFPGENGEYDIVTQQVAGENFVNVTGLKCGEYYMFAVGVDSSLTDPDKTVKGGIPFSTEQESGIIEISIPVTEVH